MLRSWETQATAPRQQTIAPNNSLVRKPGIMLNAINKMIVMRQWKAISCFRSVVVVAVLKEVGLARAPGNTRSWSWFKNFASSGSMGACSSIQFRYEATSVGEAEINLFFVVE
jgi:hypothetical protein